MSNKYTIEELDSGQLGAMWNMLRVGHQKSNIPALKNLCDQLRQAMIQKTGGNRKNDPKHYVRAEDFGTIINGIVIEAMCLYLSGDLDRLEAMKGKEDD